MIVVLVVDVPAVVSGARGPDIVEMEMRMDKAGMFVIRPASLPGLNVAGTALKEMAKTTRGLSGAPRGGAFQHYAFNVSLHKTDRAVTPVRTRLSIAESISGRSHARPRLLPWDSILRS